MKGNDQQHQNLQDVFLNDIRKNKTTVTIFLTNGVKLQGIVTSFDNFSLLLKKESFCQFIYKHAISTIIPLGGLKLFDGNQDGNEDNKQPEKSADCCCN